MSALADFRARVEAPGGPQPPEAIALALAAAVRERCAEVGLGGAETEAWGCVVSIALSRSSVWEAVALGPDDFQFYPGRVKGTGMVQWPNVWTAEYFSLSALIDGLAARIDEVAKSAAIAEVAP